MKGLESFMSAGAGTLNEEMAYDLVVCTFCRTFVISLRHCFPAIVMMTSTGSANHIMSCVVLFVDICFYAVHTNVQGPTQGGGGGTGVLPPMAA